jgi:hypothetical protein
MRFLISWLFAASCLAGPRLTFRVSGGPPDAWPAVLSSIGLQHDQEGEADIVVLRPGSPVSPQLNDFVDRGGVLILEGRSPAAEMFGFLAGKSTLRVRNIEEARSPQLAIIWDDYLELPRFEIPQGTTVFTRERWTGAPLIAGVRRGQGAVLWIASDPGKRGYERFPFLPHALGDLGVAAPFRGRDLWAFFDSSYRMRADVEYLARRWRSAGIAALHVAAWHYYEPDPERDAYLERLIRICHQNAILVYAWLELPHVSEKFWHDHPEWREKTADLADAHLDWRKLMNLADPKCADAVKSGIRNLISRFDWDGVNLAELYFESLEGAGNPSRFTPLNTVVREMFRREKGMDPIELFRPGHDVSKLREFLEFRVALAKHIQKDWLDHLDSMRRSGPSLDLVLTHVDDHLDGKMRDAIGADAAAILPLLRDRRVTFMIEDPATVWHLNSDRYSDLAQRYTEIAPDGSRLALDINVVERYQNVYPTKQQTGLELLQLIRASATRFPRTALYFEKSILPMDWPWLSAATAIVDRAEVTAKGLRVESKRPVLVNWEGGASVNGKPWFLGGDGTIMLPGGTHEIASIEAPPRPFIDFNGELLSIEGDEHVLQVDYRADSRAIVILRIAPAKVTVQDSQAITQIPGREHIVFLPAGRHVARFEFAANQVRGW